MKTDQTEWVAGIIELASTDALVWLEGAEVVASKVEPTGTLLQHAADSLREARERPLFGEPRTPNRIRVATEELAAVIRAATPDVEVVVARTPEIDLVGDVLFEEENGLPGEPMALEHEAALFRAGAALFRSEPWQRLPNGGPVVISAPALDIEDWAFVSYDDGDGAHGILLFESFSDLADYVDSLDDPESEEVVSPPNIGLAFRPKATVDAERLALIEAQGWEVASSDAYPEIETTNFDHRIRTPLEIDAKVVEAVALALPPFLQDEAAIARAYEGGEPYERALQVDGLAGKVEVTLRAPGPKGGSAADLVRAILDASREPANEPDEEFDEAWFEHLETMEDELLDLFELSPQAAALDEVGLVATLARATTAELGVSLVSFPPEVLPSLLFVTVPIELPMKPAAARPLIEELAAFYAFLETTNEVPHAAACRALLDETAIVRLETAFTAVARTKRASDKDKKAKRRAKKAARRKNR